jgi:KipI family sensor histidine kinase inhibitor
MSRMQARAVGEHALLIDCADAGEVAGTYAVLLEHRAELGAIEVVPAARTVLLDGLADPAASRDLIRSWSAAVVSSSAAGAEIEVPVTYDGADLDEVARQWETTTADVVRIHAGTQYLVAFCGFAPGFAYCTGLPRELHVRRRAEPRTAVPAGSVALAGEYTGVYPRTSPGGWQLIGRTTAELWRPDRADPALLVPGTRVRFVDG